MPIDEVKKSESKPAPMFRLSEAKAASGKAAKLETGQGRTKPKRMPSLAGRDKDLTVYRIGEKEGPGEKTPPPPKPLKSVSSTDDMYKSLVSRGESLLQKGYPSENITQWADQFYGTLMKLEALQCLKDRAEVSKRREDMYKNQKTWSELQEMPKSRRETIQKKYAAEGKKVGQAQATIYKRMCDLEQKLLDHKIAETKDETKMKKSVSSTDDLYKATPGEGSRGGQVIGHTAGGKPIYEGQHKEAAASHADHKKRLYFAARKHKRLGEDKLAKLASNAARKHNNAYGHHGIAEEHAKGGSFHSGPESAKEEAGTAHRLSRDAHKASDKYKAEKGGDTMKKSLVDHRIEGLPFNLSEKPVTEDMSKSTTHGQTSFGVGELMDEMVDVRQKGANGGMPDEDIESERQIKFHEPETCVIKNAPNSTSPYGKSY